MHEAGRVKNLKVHLVVVCPTFIAQWLLFLMSLILHNRKLVCILLYHSIFECV